MLSGCPLKAQPALENGRGKFILERKSADPWEVVRAQPTILGGIRGQ